MSIPDTLQTSPFSRFYPNQADIEWMDVFGYAVPIHCGDPEGEYEALRTAVSAMEFSMLYRWDVTGDGALAAVNRVFSRDLVSLGAGRIAYGVFVDDSGHMIDDVTVIAPSPEHVRVIGGNFAQDDELLRASAGGSIEITERRAETAHISIQGPRSRELLGSMTDADLSNAALPYYSYLQGVEVAGVECHVNRMGFTAELGYELMMPRSQAAALGEALVAAGTPMGMRFGGGSTVMTARIEAGMIMADLEYDHTSTPFECRLGWAVDFDKKDFRGRAALQAAKATAPDRVVSVVIDGADMLEFAPVSVDGQQVGVVTMAFPSPVLQGRTLGLARVRREAAAVGTKLTGAAGDQTFDAEVVKTPVYDPDRQRVRS